ncbi:hypothetical protein NYE39_02055 [Janibacter sp. FSL W8-0316]|uniref:hypothetical protein n=1 Tax=Janibacter sp. FSL W8-0316 TaxID=2975325 RepID=UPI0030F7DD60
MPHDEVAAAVDPERADAHAGPPRGADRTRGPGRVEGDPAPSDDVPVDRDELVVDGRRVPGRDEEDGEEKC